MPIEVRTHRKAKLTCQREEFGAEEGGGGGDGKHGEFALEVPLKKVGVGKRELEKTDFLVWLGAEGW